MSYEAVNLKVNLIKVFFIENIILSIKNDSCIEIDKVIIINKKKKIKLCKRKNRQSFPLPKPEKISHLIFFKSALQIAGFETND